MRFRFSLRFLAVRTEPRKSTEVESRCKTGIDEPRLLTRKDAEMKIKEIMGRRAFIARAVALTGLGVFLLSREASAIEALDPEVLKRELCAKTRLEEEFVEDVLEQTKSGTIPKELLLCAYRYALKKGRSQRLIYFRYCLVTLGKRSGLNLELKQF